MKIKVVQSSEFLLNLGVDTTIGPTLWLMDPWNTMRLWSPVPSYPSGIESEELMILWMVAKSSTTIRMVENP